MDKLLCQGNKFTVLLNEIPVLSWVLLRAETETVQYFSHEQQNW
jgi:hypothetical protein